MYVRKGQLQCHVAQTSGNAERNDLLWCFDSGCSRHMTGTLGNLAGYKDVPSRKVRFGDGGYALVKGKRYTSGQTLPHLTDVYHVEGLKANLISISQLCDDGLNVVFTQRECRALDKHGFVKMEGHRAANNCYMYNPEEVCYTASQIDESPSEEQSLGSLPEYDHRGDIMSSVQEFTIVHNELAGSIQVHNQQGIRLFSFISDQFVWSTCLRWLKGRSADLRRQAISVSVPQAHDSHHLTTNTVWNLINTNVMNEIQGGRVILDSSCVNNWKEAMEWELNLLKSVKLLGSDICNQIIDEAGLAISLRHVLLAQGYIRMEDESQITTHLARGESIRFLLGCACAAQFYVYQMVLKRGILSGEPKREWVENHPRAFGTPGHPYSTHKLKPAVYCLKQLPKTYYER